MYNTSQNEQDWIGYYANLYVLPQLARLTVPFVPPRMHKIVCTNVFKWKWSQLAFSFSVTNFFLFDFNKVIIICRPLIPWYVVNHLKMSRTVLCDKATQYAYPWLQQVLSLPQVLTKTTLSFISIYQQTSKWPLQNSITSILCCQIQN